jgi:hypothetical protein
MPVFLDEKYTPGNMKDMHTRRTNILAKKLLYLQMESELRRK